MKLIRMAVLSACFLSAGVAGLSAQSAQDLYQKKYSYDLKTDKISVNFDHRLYYLRQSALQNETLTLTFLIKGDTPTTAKEFLTFLQFPLTTTLDEFANQIIAKTRTHSPIPVDVLEFSGFEGGEQKVLTVIVQDKVANVIEDTQFRLVQLTGKPLTVLAHTKRVKLTEVNADPEKAVAEIGDQRSRWLKALSELSFTF